MLCLCYSKVVDVEIRCPGNAAEPKLSLIGPNRACTVLRRDCDDPIASVSLST